MAHAVGELFSRSSRLVQLYGKEMGLVVFDGAHQSNPIKAVKHARGGLRKRHGPGCVRRPYRFQIDGKKKCF